MKFGASEYLEILSGSLIGFGFAYLIWSKQKARLRDCFEDLFLDGELFLLSVAALAKRKQKSKDDKFAKALDLTMKVQAPTLEALSTETNFEKHFREESQNLEFRAQYSLFEIFEQLAVQIKGYREAKGLSLAQLAEMLEMSELQASQFENTVPNSAQFTFLDLAKIADVLNLDLIVVFDEWDDSDHEVTA
ncbi:MAG TPA: helix-turn-helix transcriptional regulator [Drouetiella sp.]